MAAHHHNHHHPRRRPDLDDAPRVAAQPTIQTVKSSSRTGTLASAAPCLFRSVDFSPVRFPAVFFAPRRPTTRKTSYDTKGGPARLPRWFSSVPFGPSPLGITPQVGARLARGVRM